MAVRIVCLGYLQYIKHCEWVVEFTFAMRSSSEGLRLSYYLIFQVWKRNWNKHLNPFPPIFVTWVKLQESSPLSPHKENCMFLSAVELSNDLRKILRSFFLEKPLVLMEHPPVREHTANLIGSGRADGSRSLVMHLIWLKHSYWKATMWFFELQGTDYYENSTLTICGII